MSPCRFLWMKLHWCTWSKTYIMGVGLVQSLEGLNRTENGSPLSKRDFCLQTAFGLKRHYRLFSAPSCWSTLQIFNMPASILTWANSLKYLTIYTHTTGSVPLTNTLPNIPPCHPIPNCWVWKYHVGAFPPQLGLCRWLICKYGGGERRSLSFTD